MKPGLERETTILGRPLHEQFMYRSVGRRISAIYHTCVEQVSERVRSCDEAYC